MIPLSGVIVRRTIKGDFRMYLGRCDQDYMTLLKQLPYGTKVYGIDGEPSSSNKLKSVKQIWEIQTHMGIFVDLWLHSIYVNEW